MIEDLWSELNEEYNRIRDSGKTPSTINVDSNGEEHVLYGGDKFRGRCRVCGVWDHKATTCRQWKNSSGGHRNFNNTSSSTSSGNSSTMGNLEFNSFCHYRNVKFLSKHRG
jgi:hypothetical protein